MQKASALAFAALLSVSQFACGFSAPDDDTETAEELDTLQDRAPEEESAAADEVPSVATGGIAPSAVSGQTCSVTKDAQGFFVRYSAKSSYVAYIPTTYSHSKPMRVIVGLHGCGDTARNFASWGINPAGQRASQTHIGISVGGETGNNGCWNMSGADDAKIAAAIDDLSQCYWLDKKKVVLAGYSSGGQLAYRVGMRESWRFAGLLIENSSLYAAGDVQSLLWSASWRLPIAHRQHTGDTVFPITKVRTDWNTLWSWKFPLTTSELAGGHSGITSDWEWLIPRSAGWVAP